MAISEDAVSYFSVILTEDNVPGAMLETHIIVSFTAGLKVTETVLHL